MNKNVLFSNNASPVNIGSTTGCAGNLIEGNLQITTNTAAVQVFGNQVLKNLQCSGNTAITGGGNTAAAKQGQCSVF